MPLSSFPHNLTRAVSNLAETRDDLPGAISQVKMWNTTVGNHVITKNVQIKIFCVRFGQSIFATMF